MPFNPENFGKYPDVMTPRPNIMQVVQARRDQIMSKLINPDIPIFEPTTGFQSRENMGNRQNEPDGITKDSPMTETATKMIMRQIELQGENNG
jgi:hypothetical protein